MGTEVSNFPLAADTGVRHGMATLCLRRVIYPDRDLPKPMHNPGKEDYANVNVLPTLAPGDPDWIPVMALRERLGDPGRSSPEVVRAAGD
jgi:hypothetical protein